MKQMILINRKKRKQKKRRRVKQNLYQSSKFTFYKHHGIKKFTSDSFVTKLKDLNEFNTNLVLFYKETIGMIQLMKTKKRNRIQKSCIR